MEFKTKGKLLEIPKKTKNLGIFLVMFLSLILIFSPQSAQAGRDMDLSMFVTEKDSGKPLTGNFDITFQLFDQEEGGSTVWEETQNFDIYYGVVSTILGKDNPFPEDLEHQTTDYYLGIIVDGDSMNMRKRLSPTLLSVNSLYSEEAQNSATLQNRTIGEEEGDIPLLGTGGVLDTNLLPTDLSYLGDEIDISDETNLATSGSLLALSGDTLSIKEGTLTNGHLCTYSTTQGLVCTTSPSTNSNYYLNGSSFNSSTGELTLTVEGTDNQIVDLDGRYLTSYTETDPIFSAHSASGITPTNITNWNTAHSWGDHSIEGYLTGTKVDSFNTRTGAVTLTNTDITNALTYTPYNSTNPAGYITDGNTNWDNSYGFITNSSTDTFTNKSGNISMWTNDSGYLTSYTENDPRLPTHSTSGNLLQSNGTAWVSWTPNYLTSYTETDPVFTAWDKSTGISITESQISDLQTYLTTVTKSDLTNSGTLSFDWLDSEIADTLTITGGSIDSTSTIDKDPTITLGGDLSGSLTLSNLAGGTLTSSITQANIDHGSISGLTDDDHSQYALLAGRDNNSLAIDQIKAYDLAGLLLTDDSNNGIFVEDGGQVGIGTITPSSKLDVSGSGIFYDQTATTGSTTLTIRAGAGQATNPLLQWQNNAGTGLGVIDESGNVGIGVVDPSNKLEIDGNTLFFNQSSNTGTNSLYTFKDQASNLGSGYLVDIYTNDTSLLNPFRVSANNQTLTALTVDSLGRIGIGTDTINNQMSILGDVDIIGNLGIGTSSPDTKLDVAGEIKMSSTGAVCNSTTEGAIRYVSSGKYFEGCNGTAWTQLSNMEGSNATLTLTLTTGDKDNMDVTSDGNDTNDPDYGSAVTFTLENTGDYTSETITTSLTQTTNFEITTDNCHSTTLSGSSTCTIEVTPKASANASYSGNLEITANNNPSISMSGASTGWFFCGTSTVDDIQSNTYSTVEIGTQCWLGENMRTTLYPDGSSITKGPATHGDSAWGTDQAFYSCPPNTSNDGEDCTAATTLGMLYQWSAAMNSSTTPGTQGICPDGWHIPTDSELYTLENYLATGTCSSTRTGYECDPAGSKLANNTADQNWTSGTLSSHTDFGTSGFDAPASGLRSSNGNYGSRSSYACFWSSTESGTNAWRRDLSYNNSTVHRNESDKANGFSVRCLKD
jgi:uncharacterized protein (TIGR02145 family)